MKTLLALILVSAFAMPTLAADSKAADVAKADAAKTKKACVTQKDAKTGKEKEVCKTVKVHKKHEGTTVEGTKPEKQEGKKK